MTMTAIAYEDAAAKLIIRIDAFLAKNQHMRNMTLSQRCLMLHVEICNVLTDMSEVNNIPVMSALAASAFHAVVKNDMFDDASGLPLRCFVFHSSFDRCLAKVVAFTEEGLTAYSVQKPSTPEAYVDGDCALWHKHIGKTRLSRAVLHAFFNEPFRPTCDLITTEKAAKEAVRMMQGHTGDLFEEGMMAFTVSNVIQGLSNGNAQGRAMIIALRGGEMLLKKARECRGVDQHIVLAALRSLGGVYRRQAIAMRLNAIRKQ